MLVGRKPIVDVKCPVVERAFLQLGQQAGIFKGSKKDLRAFHGPRHAAPRKASSGKSTVRQKRS